MKRACLLIAVVIGMVISTNVYAQDQYTVLAQGDFFTIRVYDGFQSVAFLEKIKSDYFLKSNRELLPTMLPKDMIVLTMDSVFLEVCETLGIGLYDFSGEVVIVKDQAQISRLYEKISGQPLDQPAFYHHEEHTLYLSDEGARPGILVHEMTHAILSHYFVVPPSPKLQEILSGYVEYHFRQIL